jgi:hypothetical protein
VELQPATGHLQRIKLVLSANTTAEIITSLLPSVILSCILAAVTDAVGD